MIDFSKKQVLYLTYFILSLLGFFAFFSHLDCFPLTQWDESRQAVNAFEMIHNKKILVNYYDGAPDMWSTKTPFFVWFVAASMKLFGYNLFALRLPSALFGTTTAAFLLFLSKNYLKEMRIGIISVLVLITANGFLGSHVSRTADCDVLLTLLISVYSVYFFKYLNETDRREQNKSLWIFTLALTFAVLTKNIVGLMMIPGIIIYVVATKRTKSIFTDIRIYRSVLIFLFITSCVYIGREIQNHGYLKEIWWNDVSGRYFKTNEGHEGLFWFYLNNFINGRFAPWIYLILPVILISFANPSPIIRKLVVYLSVLCVSFFLFISFSETKITWYDAPLYPLMALLVGIGLFTIYQAFIKMLSINYKEKIYFPLLMIFIFFIPYRNMAIFVTGHKWEDNSPGHYLLKVEKKFPSFKKAVIVSDNRQVVFFYKEVLESRGKKIVIADMRTSGPEKGDTLCCCYPWMNDIIESKYNYDLIEDEGGCKTFRINGLNDDYINKLVMATVQQLKIGSRDQLAETNDRAHKSGTDFNSQITFDALTLLQDERKITDDEKNEFVWQHGIK